MQDQKALFAMNEFTSDNGVSDDVRRIVSYDN